MDGAILVVMLWTARCRRRVSTPCSRGRSAPYMVVFSNKVDMVDDKELLYTVEPRGPWFSLSEYEFPGNEIST